jgi:hypothetical protein
MQSLTKNQMRLRFVNDPYHAWMIVPLAAIHARDMENEISMHSYVCHKTGNAYLEEDVDAQKFLVRIQQEGIEPVIDDISVGEDNPIRRLPRFRPSPESF